MSIILKVKGGVPESIEIKVKPVLLGRAPSCDVVINSEFASGQHCIFFLTNGQVTVKDLKSTNGTMLNGELIKNSLMSLGDIVSVGRVEVVLDLEMMTDEEVKKHTRDTIGVETTCVDILEKTKVPITEGDYDETPDEKERDHGEKTDIAEEEKPLDDETVTSSELYDGPEDVENEDAEKEGEGSIVNNVEFLQDRDDAVGRIHRSNRKSGLELSKGLEARKREIRKNRLKKLQETISVAGVQKLVKFIKKKVND